MPRVERIDDAADARVALYRGVSDPDLLRLHGLFVAEGRLVVPRVADDHRYRIRSVLLNEAAWRDLGESLTQARPDVPIYVVKAEAFPAITGYNIHRGCLALVERPAPLSTAAVLSWSDRVVLLEGVANADNVGGVFRSALAFGASVLVTAAACDPYYRKAVRTSMGAVLKVPFAQVDDWPALQAEAQAAGFTTVALAPRDPSERLGVFAGRVTGKVLLIVGSEGEGVSPGAEAVCDARVRIPMSAGVDSLNLSVAAGIALYAIDARARRRHSGQ